MDFRKYHLHFRYKTVILLFNILRSDIILFRNIYNVPVLIVTSIRSVIKGIITLVICEVELINTI